MAARPMQWPELHFLFFSMSLNKKVIALIRPS